jgi:hypothetical protein
MKKIILALPSIILLLFFQPKDIQSGRIIHFIPHQYVISLPHPVDFYEDFVYRLGFMESTNRYNAISNTGTFLGRYQFSLTTLQDIGIDVDPHVYLNSPKLQEYSLYKYLKQNIVYLGEHYHQYQGEIINDIVITNAGLLASSHLVGHVHVKRFLDSDGELIFHDGNGVPLTKYLQEFSDIDYLTLDENVFNLFLTNILHKDTITNYYEFTNTNQLSFYSL